jgi:cyclopropane fatty-acyl-phospholipid synthase-like methyltransferase
VVGKPFSQACENNKRPIFAVIERHLWERRQLLEIGSGTGQHAVYFAEHLPHLVWQTSDRCEAHAGIRQWVEESRLPNLRSPLDLDVTVKPWPIDSTEAVFSANTAHIMSWPMVEEMMAGVGEILEPGGPFCLYGPFNYNGTYTTESNALFDQWLKDQDPESSLRHFEDVDVLADRAGLELIEDNTMPANNRLLVWRKREAG